MVTDDVVVEAALPKIDTVFLVAKSFKRGYET